MAGDQDLALALWERGDEAARALAVRIAEPAAFDPDLLERWLRDVDGWAVTDGFAGHVVRHTP